jgi:chromosomal replication initiation ATPase DnaA
MNDAETVWNACAALLRDQVASAVWSSSFQNVQPISFSGYELVLSLPSSVVRDRVHERYLGLIKANLSELGHPEVNVVLEARPPAPQELPLFDELAQIRQVPDQGAEPAPAATGPARRPRA